MTRPRQIFPGDVILGTRRCSERRFFLRPDRETRKIFEYCLALCAERHEIQIHEYIAMSNHYHLVATDPKGIRPKFFHDFNQLIARGINRIRGRKNPVFEPGSYNAPRLIQHKDVEDKCRYTILNPVAAGLVSHPSEWKGASSWEREYGKTRVIKRPSCFSDTLPARAYLTLVRPPGLRPDLSARELRALIRKRVEEGVKRIHTLMASEKRTFAGMPNVLEQDWNAAPKTQDPASNLKPVFACASSEIRREVLRRYLEFIADYCVAITQWKEGNHDVIFPPGTYLLSAEFGATVAPRTNDDRPETYFAPAGSSPPAPAESATRCS